MLELHRATADDLTDPVLDSLTRMIGGFVSDGAALGWTDPPAREELEDLLRGIVDGPAHDACGLREGNERAQHLYASEGFREYGRLADFVAPGDGTRCAKIFMVRSFA